MSVPVRIIALLIRACVGLAVMLPCALAQTPPRQAVRVSQGTPPRGGHELRSNSPVVTIRPTVIVVASGSGRKRRVTFQRGQRLTFYSPQMTQGSIVRLPDGRLGFIRRRNIRPVRPSGVGSTNVAADASRR